MPALTGSIKDAAGRPAKGAVRIKALQVREGTGGAVIDERTFDLPILDGTITGSPVLEPGPAKITLNVSGGRLRSWDVNIPAGTSVDLWTLIEQYVEFDPPVVSKVFEYMQRAEAAADRAEQGGGAGGGSLVEDPPGSGLYSPSSAGLTEDPSNPGLYLI